MEDMLASLSTYGYIVLFLYSFGGGMVAIIAAGVLSYSGKMDLTVSIAVATVSNALGDTALFYLGRYNKKMILPYLKKHRRKLALSQLLMKKYGDKIIFIQKFIYGIKTLVPIAIGFTKYSLVKFNILNLISAFLWAIILGVASYSAGGQVIKLMSKISDKPWLMMVIIGVLLGSVWLYLSFATRKKTKRF